MKTASRITLTLAAITTLAAIWQPFGTWWQFLATALLLLLIGAGFGGTADKQAEHYNTTTGRTDGDLLPEDVARELTDTDSYVIGTGPIQKPTYGQKKDDQR